MKSLKIVVINKADNMEQVIILHLIINMKNLNQPIKEIVDIVIQLKIVNNDKEKNKNNLNLVILQQIKLNKQNMFHK